MKITGDFCETQL